MKIILDKKEVNGRGGGGEVVSVIAFYCDDPSSNPVEFYNFMLNFLLKRTKVNEKEVGIGPLLNTFKKEEYTERVISDFQIIIILSTVKL